MKTNKIHRNQLFQVNNYQVINYLIIFALILFVTTCTHNIITGKGNKSIHENKK
jgi:hypothetical protein